jgi:hypothetical protein
VTLKARARFALRLGGKSSTEVHEMFLIAITAMIAVIATLLWFTNWAEARVIAGDPEPTPADIR